MTLLKELQKVAARILHNTRSVPQNLKNKFELVELAYGRAKVLTDFADWCRAHDGDGLPYPITSYLSDIDSRLGCAVEEPKIDFSNPQIDELISLSYELSGILPVKKNVAELLMVYPFDEIKDALVEYAENLTDTEVKRGIRAFYSDGGAGAIILARRRRKEIGKS